uniref:Peptidase A1 domain-containing protein n=1 Tax=Leersia perrieri TaxID=77586 RepID=A0A0D9WL63_9ORYZ
MASALLLPLLLLFVVLYPSIALAEQHTGLDDVNYIVLQTSSWLNSKAVCSRMRSPHPNVTDWAPLSRPYGPCSSSPATPAPSVADMLRSDQLRADYIQGRLSGDDDDDDTPPIRKDSMGTLSLEEHTGNGDNTSSPAAAATGGASGELPGVAQTVVFDTASDVAWLQCSPCPIPACYRQKDVLYDPTKSSASGVFSCNSPTCRQLGPYANGCINNQCQYRVQYRDGTSSSGTYISDLLTLSPTISVQNFKFGCSHAVRGRNNIPKTFYAVRLEAIEVAGQRLAVAPTVFAAGAVLDSRTMFTRLPSAAYAALRQAFRDRMRMYRMVAPKGMLDTCYDTAGVNAFVLPRITLVFDRNAAVEIDPSGILFDGCLAFAAVVNDQIPGVIGNVQLQKIEVLYNIPAGLVGFRHAAC